MNRLKISTRVWLLIGVMTAMLLGAGGVGLYGIARSNESLKTVYDDRLVPLGQLDTIVRSLLRNRLAIAHAVIEPKPELIAKNLAELDANTTLIKKNWEAYSATYLTPDEQRLARSFDEARRKLVAEGLDPAANALRAGDVKAAQALIGEKIQPLFVPLNDSIDALIKLQIDVAQREDSAAIGRFETIRALSLTAIVLGVVLTLVIGVALVRNLAHALGGEPAEVNAAVLRVAEGDLASPVPVRGGDTASIVASLSRMQQSLARIVGQVRTGVDSVATASAQIAQGNADLSARTEQQASNLQQTAASMEQMTGAVKSNADNARAASQLSASASGVAAKGGKVVAQVVTTMGEIQSASKKIAEIIGTIDGIAFQTNILALNAAVEAARAGEQGRGFAVVASEVRSLAQRSADAAKEIKSLIGASVDKVEIGSTLVAEAGQTMDEIVTQVKKVNDLIGEIAASSGEQTDGIGQVNTAVAQLDQMTQQNAALVEESAAATESLRQQAAKLSQAVSVFQLGRESTPSATAATSPTKAVTARPAPARRGHGSETPPAARHAQARSAGLPAQATIRAGDDGWVEFESA